MTHRSLSTALCIDYRLGTQLARLACRGSRKELATAPVLTTNGLLRRAFRNDIPKCSKTNPDSLLTADESKRASGSCRGTETTMDNSLVAAEENYEPPDVFGNPASVSEELKGVAVAGNPKETEIRPATLQTNQLHEGCALQSTRLVRAVEGVSEDAVTDEAADCPKKLAVHEEHDKVGKYDYGGNFELSAIENQQNMVPFSNLSERWQFLKQLPHKLIRDIGFVIASPCILLDSDELPTVSTDMIGGSDTNWQVSADWLQGLEIDQVVNWFEAQRSSTRLGDHFAFCVEYVLRFSPVVQAKHLLISQQVLHHVVQNSSSLELGTADGISDLDSTSSTSAGTSQNASDVVVEAQKKEVFVQSLNLFPYFTVEKSTGMMNTPINFNSVRDNGSLFEDLGVHCRVEPLDGSQGDADGSQNDQMFLADGTITDNNDALLGAKRQGKRKKKLLRKSQRLRYGRGVTITVGEFDFLFQYESGNEQKGHSEGQYSTCCNLTSVEDESSGNVINCRCSVAQASQELPMINGLGVEMLEVHHWEVSVKFLLYAGPWEVFKLVTPSFAAWKSGKSGNHVYKESWSLDSVGAENRQYNADYNTSDEFLTQVGSKLVAKNDAFLGCFLGPHVGETLYNRKTRLINQLALSHNVHAAALVHRLFMCHLLDEKDEKNHESDFPNPCSVDFIQEEYIGDEECLRVNDDCNISRTQESLDWSKGKESKQVGNAEVKAMRIFPRALLKGYLFYEYELWFLLSLKRNADRSSGGRTSESYQTRNCSLSEGCSGENLGGETNRMRKALEKEVLGRPLKCMVNPDHWMGWWTRIGDFNKFASSPCHRSSMWYIVPKNEWLSPVVIDENDEERCARVLNVEDFLIVSAKVAEEANRTNIPPKRRFMVAEVRRDPALYTYFSKFELESRKHQKHIGKQINYGNGAWVEVSRGFVVEESWPDSRLYRPHGYVQSWSPSLQHGI